MEAKERAPGRHVEERKTSGSNARKGNHDTVSQTDNDSTPKSIQKDTNNNSEQGRGTAGRTSNAAVSTEAKGIPSNVGSEGSFLRSHLNQGAPAAKLLLQGNSRTQLALLKPKRKESSPHMRNEQDQSDSSVDHIVSVSQAALITNW